MIQQIFSTKVTILKNAGSRSFWAMLLLPLWCFTLTQHSFAQSVSLDSLRKVLTTLPTDTSRIGVLADLGGELGEHGDFSQAMQYLNEAMGYAEKSGTGKQRIEVLKCLGNTCFYQGDNQKALEYWQMALNIAAASKDEISMNALRMNMANAYLAEGNIPLAQKTYIEVLQWAEANNRRGQALDCIANLSSVYGTLGRYDLARQYLNRALKEYGDVMTPFIKAFILDNLCNFKNREGDLEGAEQTARALIELGESNQLTRYIINAYLCLGIVANKKKEWFKARDYYISNV
jgi:tetratricopeptide (TPR) repeat protein